MSFDPAGPLNIPAEKKSELKKLTRVGKYSVPTMTLAVVCLASVFITIFSALRGNLPVWATVTLLSFIYYCFFSVIHDGAHRSICQSKKLNDFIGQLGVSVFAPFAAMHILRWAHMEHHRATNGPEDPDIWSHGPAWSLPFRWIVIDFYYFYSVIVSDTPLAKKALKDSYPYIICGTLFIAALFATGYGPEYLMYSLLPSRVAFVLLGFSFFWLPHNHWPSEEHDLEQANNRTIATSIRTGHEWFMNPVLQVQNYHLIHHLWPKTPFYNNQKIWKLIEPELRQRDLAIAKGFALKPTLHFANAEDNENK